MMRMHIGTNFFRNGVKFNGFKSSKTGFQHFSEQNRVVFSEIIIWKYWKTIKNIKKPLTDTNT